MRPVVPSLFLALALFIVPAEAARAADQSPPAAFSVRGTVAHRVGRFTLRNHTLAANYDRSYQNFVPGAVTANKALVTLTAYNNASDRTNVFNQTDATAMVSTGRLRHTLLAVREPDDRHAGHLPPERHRCR